MNATMTGTVKIESNIPIPERSRYANLTKYPFSQMEVGQSFVAKVKTIAQIYTAAKRANAKATVRTLKEPSGKDGIGEYRVWKVA